VHAVRPTDRAVVRTGSVTTEGDAAARADLVRAQGLDGSGAKLGRTYSHVLVAEKGGQPRWRAERRRVAELPAHDEREGQDRADDDPSDGLGPAEGVQDDEHLGETRPAAAALAPGADRCSFRAARPRRGEGDVGVVCRDGRRSPVDVEPFDEHHAVQVQRPGRPADGHAARLV
jgi:hypothetical protein